MNWSQSAIAIHNRVRGLYPNCVTSFRNQNLKIIATRPLGSAYWDQLPPELQDLLHKITDLSIQPGSPGEVVSITKGLGAIIQTGDGLLLLREVQMAGKRSQSGWDFVNGMRLKLGEVLG